MSEVFPPPPAYEAVIRTSNVNWYVFSIFSNMIFHLPYYRRAWHRKLIALEFTQEEASEYARLFVSNEIETNMIPELNDGVLKSIGIEKAGQYV